MTRPRTPPDPWLANPWFAALAPGLQSELLQRGELLRLQPGEMLFRQGDALGGMSGTGGSFFGLLQGRIKISSLREDGREAILAVLEAGNWFGEISLLDQRPRTHDATALGATEVLAVPRGAFDALMQGPAFASAMCRLMAGRVRGLYGMFEDATLRSTRARVARRLLLLAHGDASQDDTARRVVPVSQEALAMMLGVTRQTLGKELRALARNGAVVLRYGRIEIVSTELLGHSSSDPATATAPR